MTIRLRSHRGAALLAGFVALSLTACGSGILMRENTQEFRNEAVNPAGLRMLVVVPANPASNDVQVAGRAHEIMRQERWPAVLRRAASANEEAATTNVCKAEELNGEVHGVAFVTWDRITLRDCTTNEVAYQVLGAYAGVDVMTRKLVAYLRENR
jgi:hypothetical protein